VNSTAARISRFRHQVVCARRLVAPVDETRAQAGVHLPDYLCYGGWRQACVESCVRKAAAVRHADENGPSRLMNWPFGKFLREQWEFIAEYLGDVNA
jgi:hypothetical protein